MKHPLTYKDRLIIDFIDDLIDNLFLTDLEGDYQQSVSIDWKVRERLHDKFKTLLELKE